MSKTNNGNPQNERKIKTKPGNIRSVANHRRDGTYTYTSCNITAERHRTSCKLVVNVLESRRRSSVIKTKICRGPNRAETKKNIRDDIELRVRLLTFGLNLTSTRLLTVVRIVDRYVLHAEPPRGGGGAKS